MENRSCHNCKADFTIELDDFSFYENMGVPAPTWCALCRQNRRLFFRNLKTLYKKSSSKSDENIISKYSPDIPFPVYQASEWYTDDWDALEYGMDIDFQKPFFEHIKKLNAVLPLMALMDAKSEDFKYANMTFRSSRCYFVFGCVEDEECDYGHIVWNSKNCVDNLYVFKCEFCYKCIDYINCNKLFHSNECQSCAESIGLFDCRGCTNCIECVGLRQKSYSILNKQYTKEEYEILVPKIIEHMKKAREWGEFFPTCLSPFVYNESIIHKYTPKIKEEVLALGFIWKDDILFT